MAATAAALLCLAAWAGALGQATGAGAVAAAAAAAAAAGPLRLVPADPAAASAARGSFTIEDDRLILDGKPIQIIAGRCVWAACEA